MALTTVGAVAQAVTAVAGIAAPLISDAEAQANANLQNSLVDDWVAALACGNLDGMHAMADRLLHLAGSPVGISGRTIIVDVAYLDQFARVTAAYIAQSRLLNTLQAALAAAKK